MEKSYKKHLKNINTFVFDVDGVFTDGTLLITTQGEMLRKMSVKDGFALKTALQKSYNVCIITGGTNEGFREPRIGICVTHIPKGLHHKEEPLKEYLDVNGLKPENVLYMGDDLPDIPPMQLVGLPCCPQEAVPDV